MSYLSTDLRNRLLEADNRRCALLYRRSQYRSADDCGPHCAPVPGWRETSFENLCFACRRCNEFKGSATSAQDPLTREMVVLFHPRQQTWTNHFRWDESGMLLVGLTAVGRATIVALNMNHPVIVDVRRRWVSVGWHPPK